MPSASSDASTQPRAVRQTLVWVLTGAKAGDNAQLRTLAQATGFRVEEIGLEFNRLYRRSNLLLGPTLRTLTPPARQRLAPPWPDLVISSGRRSVPVARWIARQCGAKLVHVGRPWGKLRWFDLVIAMPQYGLPARANVFQARMAFNHADDETLAAQAARWQERFAGYNRPWLAILLGGSSPPLVFDAATAEHIADWANRWAEKTGGSVLALTSPRTDTPACDAFFQALRAPGLRHVWRPDQVDNPYVAVLALADEFVVSGDSASMLAEAVRRGKPVRIAPLTWRPGAKRRRSAWLKNLLPETLFQTLAEWTLVTPNRDLALLHRRLIGEGFAGWLDGPPPSPRPVQEDLPQAVARIRNLVSR